MLKQEKQKGFLMTATVLTISGLGLNLNSRVFMSVWIFVFVCMCMCEVTHMPCRVSLGLKLYYGWFYYSVRHHSTAEVLSDYYFTLLA